MTEKEEQPGGVDKQDVTGQLAIQKIYIKDLSFESPNAPQVFNEQLNPTVDIQFANSAKNLEDNDYEVVLTITVNVKQGERTIYIAEVQQVGIFAISGFTDEHLTAIHATTCPNILFPYAREIISDVVVKGGFPQMLLAPVNFDALYAQEMKRRKEEGESATTH